MEQELVKENPMRKIKIEKVVVSISGIGEDLEKGVKLLEMITKRKAAKMKSTKRIGWPNPPKRVRPEVHFIKELELNQLKCIKNSSINVYKKIETARNG